MNGIVNFVAFQVIWVASVVGAGAGLSLLGPGCLLAWLPVHAWLSRCPREDLLLAAGALLFGTLLDTLYQVAGLLRFEGWTMLAPVAPLWISALWVNFVLTLNHSMKWLRGRLPVAAAFGAVGGPLSYWAGVRLGAAEWVAEPVLALAVIGVAWALVTPALISMPHARVSGSPA